MEKRIFTLILVVIVGAVLSVLILNRQKKEDPMLREMLMQQAQLLENQERLIQEEKSPRSGGENSLLTMQIISLEKRVKALEQQIKSGQAAARPKPPAEDYTTVHDISVDHTPLIGPKDAAITIVEFVDFECPFCARFHPPIMEVMKQFPNDVNYMVKNFPLSFHPNAKPASKAAFAAGEQGKYIEMVDILLQNGRNLNEANYQKWAGELGLDVEQFMKDYKEKDAQWEDYIRKDMQLGAKVGVRGTPTIFLGGRKTRARDVASYKAEIEKILNEKK